MTRFQGVILLGLLLCGCGRKPAPPAAVPTGFPSVIIRRAAFLREGGLNDKAAVPTNAVAWGVTIVQFSDDAIERHGMANLFAEAPETNDVISGETQLSSLMTLARGDTNIILSLRAGVFSGFCSRESASILLEHFKRAPETEVLSLPQVTTTGTNLGQASIVNSLTVFTGAASNSSPRTPFVTNLWFGHTITLQRVGVGPQAMMIQAVVRSESFEGYARNERDRMSQYQTGFPPMFDLSVYGTRAEMRSNEVLLLGSATGASVRTMIDRVPLLSEIPAVGRLFTKVQKETNYFRRVVFITPLTE